MSAPREFPPGFAEYQNHRSRYLDARKREAEEWCALATLRQTCGRAALGSTGGQQTPPTSTAFDSAEGVPGTPKRRRSP